MMILTSGWVGIHPHLSLATRAHICLDSITLLLRVPGRSSPLPPQPEQRKTKFHTSLLSLFICCFVSSALMKRTAAPISGSGKWHTQNEPLGIHLMSEDWGDWSREGSPSYLSWDAYTTSSGSPVCLWMAPDGLFGTGPAAWRGLWPHLLGVSTANCPVSSTLSLPCGPKGSRSLLWLFAKKYIAASVLQAMEKERNFPPLFPFQILIPGSMRAFSSHLY